MYKTMFFILSVVSIFIGMKRNDFLLPILQESVIYILFDVMFAMYIAGVKL